MLSLMTPDIDALTTPPLEIVGLHISSLQLSALPSNDTITIASLVVPSLGSANTGDIQ
jgi:hypothetical protein